MMTVYAYKTSIVMMDYSYKGLFRGNFYSTKTKEGTRYRTRDRERNKEPGLETREGTM